MNIQKEELIMVVFAPSGNPFQVFTRANSRYFYMYDFNYSYGCDSYHYYMSAAGPWQEDNLYAEISQGSFWLKEGIKAPSSAGSLVKLKAMPKMIPDAAALFALGHESNSEQCWQMRKALDTASARRASAPEIGWR